jgi:predicted N-acetyltransferase YhbS
MTAVKIDLAIIDQAEGILTVIVAAFEQYREVLDPPSGVFRETTDSIRQKLEQGGGFVAGDNSQIVGAVLYQPYSDYMYLGRLAVLPEYRGRQIASQLVDRVEQAALERHLCRSQLCVRIALTGNQQLFERLGYRIISYHNHEGYAEHTFVTMEKALTT